MVSKPSPVPTFIILKLWIAHLWGGSAETKSNDRAGIVNRWLFFNDKKSV